MPMQWNEQADAKLFANVLRLHVVKLDYQALAKAMGDTVTPKAISHRISKIKEKAQVRRAYSETGNPPTPVTPKKRVPKIKTVDDEEEDTDRKRIKLEGPLIKVEESAYDDGPAARDYFWAGVWSPAGEMQQHHYDPYGQEELEGKNNGAADHDVGYGDVGAAGASVGLGLDGDCSSAYGNSST